MEDLASWVALVGKASPLLPDKRWPWPMMWNGFDWLSLIPQQSEPRSSPGARSTTVTLSDISYFTPTTMTTAGYCNSDLILLPLNISHFSPTTVTAVVHHNQSLKPAFFRAWMVLVLYRQNFSNHLYNHHNCRVCLSQPKKQPLALYLYKPNPYLSYTSQCSIMAVTSLINRVRVPGN